jgi:GcrA cell cycle regulator
MSWTDERIATLTKMWKEGKSAADIAKVLGKGVTRNAVIGKAHRMGLSGRPSPIKKPAPAKETARKDTAKEHSKDHGAAKKTLRVARGKHEDEAPAAEPAARHGHPGRAGKASEGSGAPRAANSPARAANDLARGELPRSANEVIPPGGGIPLLDLTERMCKWPIGDPRDDDFSFCGLGIRPGTPYCPAHASMAYQTSSRGRPAAAAQVKAVVVEEEPAEAGEDQEEADEEAEAEA